MQAKPDSVRDVALQLHKQRSIACLLLLLLLAGCLSLDWIRVPNKQFTSKAAIGMIHAYQSHSAFLRSVIKCRYPETCSHYAERMIQKKGFVQGITEATERINHCW